MINNIQNILDQTKNYCKIIENINKFLDHYSKQEENLLMLSNSIYIGNQAYQNTLNINKSHIEQYEKYINSLKQNINILSENLSSMSTNQLKDFDLFSEKSKKILENLNNQNKKIQEFLQNETKPNFQYNNSDLVYSTFVNSNDNQKEKIFKDDDIKPKQTNNLWDQKRERTKVLLKEENSYEGIKDDYIDTMIKEKDKQKKLQKRDFDLRGLEHNFQELKISSISVHNENDEQNYYEDNDLHCFLNKLQNNLTLEEQKNLFEEKQTEEIKLFEAIKENNQDEINKILSDNPDLIYSRININSENYGIIAYALAQIDNNTNDYNMINLLMSFLLNVNTNFLQEALTVRLSETGVLTKSIRSIVDSIVNEEIRSKVINLLNINEHILEYDTENNDDYIIIFHTQNISAGNNEGENIIECNLIKAPSEHEVCNEVININNINAINEF